VHVPLPSTRRAWLTVVGVFAAAGGVAYLARPTPGPPAANPGGPAEPWRELGEVLVVAGTVESVGTEIPPHVAPAAARPDGELILVLLRPASGRGCFFCLFPPFDDSISTRAAVGRTITVRGVIVHRTDVSYTLARCDLVPGE
jgi:hypothetical protein